MMWFFFFYQELSSNAQNDLTCSACGQWVLSGSPWPDLPVEPPFLDGWLSRVLLEPFSLQLLKLFVAQNEQGWISSPGCLTLPDFSRRHQLVVFNLCFQLLGAGSPPRHHWVQCVQRGYFGSYVEMGGFGLLNRSWRRGLGIFYFSVI